MLAVVQRVSKASVRVDGRITGEIGPGLLVLLGVRQGDGDEDASWCAAKIAGLRIFRDPQGKMNLGLDEAGGSMLVVSQFTLLGDCEKGRRPSFIEAAAPEEANRLYVRFVEEVRRLGVRVETGTFQAMMEVDLVNDGPVTLLVDSRPWRERKEARTKPLPAHLASQVTSDYTGNPGLRLLGLRGGPLALASRSPRRRELLERLKVPLLVLPTEVEEGNRREGEPPEDYVTRLAREKAAACRDEARRQHAYACLGADTVVEVDGEVLEQPRDPEDAVRLLRTIGGRWHTVYTGLVLVGLESGRSAETVEASRVFFDRLEDDELKSYLETGEPMDKAGAYGIQGWGGIFVPRIEGDYFNVMGLPLAALRRICREMEEPR